jgi:hypothetical protein
MNMSLTTGAGKEGIGLTFLPSLLVHRKRKRDTEKQREEKSVRSSVK